ncbi:ABC transporter permease subunit [Solimonas soli]|uniref:ABC transporter permease subunit n=1 Tax=Solimonas soli TaxID=413479 RepID=UPI00048467D6|nr:ABC transporter permease subunit [Solimonas soli]
MNFLRHDRALSIAVVLLAVLLVFVVVGPWFSPYACDEIDFAGDWSAPPTLAGAHWFGTDSLGRDLFVRGLCGGRLSLLVGLASTLVSLLIGVLYGAVAGYVGGRLDTLMMRGVDVLYALPFMFFVIVLMVLFGRHLLLMFVAIGAVNWLDMARVVRGQTLALRRRDFVAAAQLSGLRDRDIILRHIVPNLASTVVVYAALTLPQVILIESFLSFLGLGVQEPATSWGALVNDGAREMETAPWSLLFPATLLTATLLLLNVIGERLRLRFARPATSEVR